MAHRIFPFIHSQHSTILSHPHLPYSCRVPCHYGMVLSNPLFWFSFRRPLGTLVRAIASPCRSNGTLRFRCSRIHDDGIWGFGFTFLQCQVGSEQDASIDSLDSCLQCERRFLVSLGPRRSYHWSRCTKILSPLALYTPPHHLFPILIYLFIWE